MPRRRRKRRYHITNFIFHYYSPSLLFLSQSVLHKDMRMRVAHEVCHTWFGVTIGPRDWTEEWMTEGFCTYLEDIVHTKVMEVNKHFDLWCLTINTWVEFFQFLTKNLFRRLSETEFHLLKKKILHFSTKFHFHISPK